MKSRTVDSKYIETFCSGCGLCHTLYGCELSIDMKGFPVIQIDERTPQLNKICPVFYYDGEAKHGVWGNVQKALVGYSSDSEVRFKAASGGALTEICIYLLESKEVNGIIHTTFDPNDQTKTITCISYSADEVRSRCGSRYSISVPLFDLKEFLKDGDTYAFVGKPCDVMALRRGIEEDPLLGEKIPYLISFFCAGEPSVNAQNELLKAMGTTTEKMSSVTYRGNGWPGYTTVIEKDGSIHKMEYKDAWSKHLGRDIRMLCRFCLDGTGDAADIVCADFWHLTEEDKTDFTEHDGRNIIISRNEKGTRILKGAIESGRITVESDFTNKIDEKFHLYQPAQYKRKGTMGSMIFAMKLCRKEAPRYSSDYLKKYSRCINSSVKLKFFIGTLKRIIRKRV